MPAAPSVAAVSAIPIAPTPTTITGNITSETLARIALSFTCGKPITASATPDSANTNAK
jgi:hypothetical protein